MINFWKSLLEYPQGTLLFLISFLNLFWIGYILFNKKHTRIINGYVFYAFSIFLWVFTDAYFQSEFLIMMGERFAKGIAILNNLGGNFFMVGLFYISCLLKNPTKKLGILESSIIGLVSLISLFLNLYPGLTVIGVKIIDTHTFILELGHVAVLSFLISSALIIPSIINAIIGMRKKNHQIETKKNAYMLVAFFIYTGIVYFNIIRPLFLQDYSFVWIAHIVGFVDLLFVGYLLFVKRFFDLWITAQRVMIYVSNTFLYMLLFLCCLKLFDNGSISIEVFGILCLIGGGIVVILWKWTLETFDIFWNYVFYHKKRNSLKAIRESLKGFKKSMNFGIEELTKILEIQASYFVFAGDISSGKFQSLFQFFQTHPGQDLVKEEVDYEIRNIERRNDLEQIKKNMEAYMVSAAIPVLDSDKFFLGVFFLEQKINGKLFSSQEMSEIKILLKNATIYISKYLNQKVIKENLENSLTAEKEFMTGLIHEIRTPLFLAENLKNLIDWKKLKIEDQEFLLSSQEGLQELSHKLNRVSEAFQWKNQMMPLEKTFGTLEIFFDAILKEVWDGEIELKLAKNLKGKLLEFDFHNLKIAVREIIKNAFFFNQQKFKRLKIKVDIMEDEVVFDFEDNGIGIEKENWEKIFELLYVVAFSRNLSECGLGVGLSITKGIVKGHYGTLKVLQSDIGMGTIICLRLPLSTL